MADDAAPEGPPRKRFIVGLDGVKRPHEFPHRRSKQDWLRSLAERKARAGEYLADSFWFVHEGGIVSPFPEMPSREELIVDRMRLREVKKTKHPDGRYTFEYLPPLSREEAEAEIDEFLKWAPEAKAAIEKAEQEKNHPAA